VDFRKQNVERLLCAIGARADVAKDIGAITKGVVRRIDAVAQPTHLADFGEQPRAHAIA